MFYSNDIPSFFMHIHTEVIAEEGLVRQFYLLTATAALQDVILQILQRKRNLLFHALGLRPSVFAKEIFVCLLTVKLINNRMGIASSSGSSVRFVMPRNLRDHLELLPNEKKMFYYSRVPFL